MKHTLSYTAGIIALAFGLITSTVFAQTTANGPYYATPSWDQTLPAATRFIVLSNFAGAAVLDRETGLVWEQSPSTSSFPWSSTTKTTAATHCNNLTVGNRKGWRLPAIQELASLVDLSAAFPGPTLPPGHPFTNVAPGLYWSANSSVTFPFAAWTVYFHTGEVSGNSKDSEFGIFAWCVRGGQGPDPQ